MLSCALEGAAAAEVTPGLGVGVTGLGGPSGTGLGLPGWGGGHKEAEEDVEEEEVVVVTDTPNLGEAIWVLWGMWMRPLVEDLGLQSERESGWCVWEEREL